MSTDTVLFELGTEELPAGEYVGMAEALCTGICDGLQSHSLSHGEAKVLATPRRLTVIVYDVAMNAADTEQQILGPPIAAAKTKEGEWSPDSLAIRSKGTVRSACCATAISRSKKKPKI